MSQHLYSKAFVITDHDDCTICRDYAVETIVFDDPADIIQAILRREQNVAVFVDVRFYIKLGAEARNRLLAVARGVPVFRIRYSASDNAFLFIDTPGNSDADAQCRDDQEMFKLRCEERVPVQLNILLAKEEDPFVHNAEKSNIANISRHGCFVLCVDSTPYKGFLYIRINELSNRRPILCNIRWHREWGVEDKFPGMGVQFVDIEADQLRELETMYLTPHFLSLEEA